MPYYFVNKWNLSNKQIWEGKKRSKPRNRLLTIEKKRMATRGKVGRGMGEKGDGDEGGHL